MLSEVLTTLRAIINGKGPATLPQIAYLKQCLYCFPELHASLDPQVDAALRGQGGAARIAALIHDGLRAAMDPSDLADMALRGAVPLDLGATSESRAIVSMMSSSVSNVPPGDSLYLAASARVLRQKLLATEEGTTLPQQAADILKLRGYFPQPAVKEIAAEPPSAKAASDIDTIRIMRQGASLLGAMQSSYATYDPTLCNFSATEHKRGAYFLYGPYISLSAGQYTLSLSLFSAKHASIALEIVSGLAGRLHILHRMIRDLEPGQTRFDCEFHWSGQNGQLFEGRVMVMDPAFGKLQIDEYRLKDCG
jgi:hypothetical protein